jgi:hypothetical protein
MKIQKDGFYVNLKKKDEKSPKAQQIDLTQIFYLEKFCRKSRTSNIKFKVKLAINIDPI